MNQYQLKALRTESPTTPEVLARLQANAHTFQAVYDLGRRLFDIANPLKSGIYYGKYPTPELVRSPTSIRRARLLHGALGVLTEAFEVFEVILNEDVSDEETIAKLEKELGDLGWFRALCAAAADLDLDDVDRKNIVKLEVRYPEKFTEELAQNKDEAKEMEAMNRDE